MTVNEIYNIDFLKGIEQIPDKSIDLLITDPPYLHVKGGMKSKRYNRGSWASESQMVTTLSDFDETAIYTFLDSVLPKMKKANCYIFCSKLQLVSYFKYLSEHKKLKYDLLVWDKCHPKMKSTKFFTSDLEYIIRIYEAGVSLHKVYTEDGTKSDVRYYTKRQAFKQPYGKHNTMKPVELIERLIRVSSFENDVVLDTFLGTGTTAIACQNTNRQYIGYEIDPIFFNEAKQRIEENKSI